MDPHKQTLEESLAKRTTRLGEPSFPSERSAIYERALAAMEEADVDYLLGGAHALNAWTGIWRDTKDLDIFVRPRHGNAALAALKQNGFRTEVVYESWLGKAWDGDTFVDVIWRNANGLFPVTDEWFEHAPTRRMLGHEVKMLPLEEAILSKIMVGNRDRFDGADILHMIFASGETIDWDRLARGVGEHIELLTAYLHMYRWGYPEWADKVPLDVLDRYHALARKRLDEAREPFRAGLMDIPSFRVDVEDWGLPDPHKRVLGDIFGDAEGRQ